MNKYTHRYESLDYISKIQSNLKEMKQEVAEYLKKHNNDKVPPILKARHYLLIGAINDIGNVSQNLKPQKIVQDLCSEKLGHVADGDLFEPLRDNEIRKRENSKLVKQSKSISFKNDRKNAVQADLNCLLPNICNISYEFHDQAFTNQDRVELSNDETQLNPIMQNSLVFDNQAGNQRYHIIDQTPQKYRKKLLRQTLNDNLIHKRNEKVDYCKNKSMSVRRNQILSQSLTGTKNHTVKKIYDQKQQKKFQTLKQKSFWQNANHLNQIKKTSLQFDEHSHTLQRKRIYKKVNKQLEKGTIYKFKQVKYNKNGRFTLNSQKLKGPQLGSKQISHKSELFEPWQDQIQKKQNNDFLPQNHMF